MRSIEPDLFGFVREAEYPDVPGHRGVDTSREAAEAMAPRCGRLQQMTLDAIRNAAWNGLTADEAADACGLDRWSIQPRVSELKAKHLIVDGGSRRLNATGRRAIVWVACEYQQRQAA